LRNHRRSKTICGWLADENLQGGYGAQIVDDARRQIAMPERTGKLPHHVVPPDMPAEEIIQRCRAAELKNDSISFIALYLI
jgi:hypothetical protein